MNDVNIFILKKRDILQWYSVWPVDLKVILASEYTPLPNAKDLLLTNWSGSIDICSYINPVMVKSQPHCTDMTDTPNLVWISVNL